MAHSLEARVPFLDTQVAELALALDTRQKVRGFSKKRLLRRAVEPLLPREIVRGRKQGFSIPVAAWLRGDLEPFARDVLSPETDRAPGLPAPEAVTRVLDEHVSGREDLSRQIWGLLSFTLWFDRYAREPARGRRRDWRRRLMPDTIDALFAFIFAGAAVWTSCRPPSRSPGGSATARSTTRTSAACMSSRRPSSAAWRCWWRS